MIDVYFDTMATDAERAEIEQWRVGHDSADVEYVSIEKPAVLVHGSDRRFGAVIGSAQRQGKLTGELSAALATMRRARDL